MAQRRMFSLKVIDTDSFLDMSPTAQNLYFHLGMRADDDGFVASPKKIMKMVSAPDDDMKVLIGKGFIVPMATNGVCIISHWKINNLIKSDRYTETLYLEEKSRLIEENGVYKVDILSSKMVPQLEPQDRLGKDRLGQIRLEKTKAPYGEFQNVLLSLEEWEKLIERMGESNTKLLIEELSSYMASKGKRYSSHYATILAWARRKIGEHVEKQQNKKERYIA